MNIKIDINVCRICLQTGSGTALYSLQGYAEKFEAVTQLQISENDGLPETLCAKCVGRLKVSYEFKRQSESSDQHLRCFILEVHSKFSKVTTLDGLTEEEELRMLLEADCQSEEPEIKPPAKLSIVPEKTTTTTTTTKKKVGAKPLSLPDFPTPVKLTTKVEPVEALDEEQETIVGDDDVRIADEADASYDEGSGETVEDHLTEFAAIDDYQISQHSFDGIVEYIEEDLIDVEQPAKRRRRIKTESQSNHACPQCNKVFSNRTNMMRHMLTHASKKPFECKECGSGFTQSGSLKQHMYIHTGERPYRCPICHSAFTQSKSLKFHMRRHTGEKPFTCVECGISFRQRDGLKRHELVKHGNAPTFDCTECNRKLTSKHSLAVHMRKHASVGQLSDNIKYESDATVKYENITTNVKQYKCSVCNKSYAIKQNWINHCKTHDIGNTQVAETSAVLTVYRCEDCNAGFRTERSLQAHRKSQHAVDTNDCDICNVSFERLADLIEHNQIEHTLVYEKCGRCEFEFESQKMLDEHMFQHEINDIEGEEE